MSSFAQHNRPLVNLRKFMSPKMPAVARQAVVRRTESVDTKAALDAAERNHYAAEEAKELKKKHNTVIKTQKKLAIASTKLQAAKVVEAQKDVAKNIVPNHHDKTQVIKEHSKAEGDRKDAQDKYNKAKKDHKAAQVAVQAGGRRRHTRHKRRKSKHGRRKRRTKKRRRKRHTRKHRKRHTKTRRRSRRR
jgi:CRISPR/Cas system-associated protein Csx1